MDTGIVSGSSGGASARGTFVLQTRSARVLDYLEPLRRVRRTRRCEDQLFRLHIR